jgi:GT2 family glycosyltransferase
MNVSIIIVSYNTRQLLINCIDSIYKQTSEVQFEIIVVDNNSKDRSVNEIQKRFPKVIIIESKENLGFGKASNLGSKIALGDFLFFLNSDTILFNNAVKLFHDFLDYYKLENVHFVGAVLYDESNKIIHSSGDFPTTWGILKSLLLRYTFGSQDRKKEFSRRLNKDYFEVNYITGADLFVTSEIFRNLNGFDEDFFMYYEDTDLQKRAEYMGYRRVLICDPHIVHLEGGSNEDSSYSILRTLMFNRSMSLYFRKHIGKFKFLIFKIIFILLRSPKIFDTRSTLKDRFVYFRGLMRL